MQIGGSASQIKVGSQSRIESIETEQTKVDKSQGLTKKTVLIAGSLMLLLLVFVLLFVFFTRKTATVYTNVRFDFRVFCPISYEADFMDGWEGILNSIPSEYNLIKDLSRTYVVIANSNSVNNTQCNGDPTTDPNCHDDLVRYCGLVRKWGQTCENAELQYVCSTPGPIFDLEIDEQIIVLWVNNVSHLNPTAATFPDYEESRLNACYNGTDDRPPRCTQHSKPEDWEGCQYNDPNNLGDHPIDNYNIDTEHWPTSTHIHGLEVRPAFDGNPLSWFSRDSQGVGYLSLEDAYFGQHSIIEAKEIKDFFASEGHKIKINVYKNVQPAGSLWYHDHAMASTGFNVRKGMVCMYLLRNSSLESKALPIKKYQQNLLIAFGSYEAEETRDGRATTSQKEFESDVWWRLRILNSDFKAVFDNLRFAYNTSSNEEVSIPFHIIGTDSALRRNVLHNQTSIVLSSAERVDILIKFDSTDLPRGSKIYFVQGDRNGTNYKLLQMTVGKKCTDPDGLNYTPPETIDVPYTNLSAMADSQISKIRMRPLIRSSDIKKLGVNGHLHQHNGDSEKPQIGTTEDWYFINGMFTYNMDHPMHIHLINFQEIRQFTLKKMQVNYDPNIEEGGPEIYMSYYEMDFYLQPNVSCTWNGYAEIKQKYEEGTLGEEDYKVLGKWITYTSTVEQITECFQNFKSENVFDSNRVSSLDVRMEGPTTNYRKSDDGCSLTNHLYLCDDKTSDLPEYKKGWKETSFVPHGYVSVIRIRWTSTDYDSAVDGTNYFHVPEKHIIQFPGYVYHCHFLHHEDLGLMRSIMMQPSAASNLSNWESSYKEYNAACQQTQSKRHFRR